MVPPPLLTYVSLLCILKTCPLMRMIHPNLTLCCMICTLLSAPQMLLTSRNPHTACLMGTGPCFLRQRSAHLILLSHLLLLLCVQPGARADNDTTCKLWQAPQPSTLYTWIASPSTRQRAQVMPGNQVWAAECPINPNLSHTEMDCPNSPLSPDATGQTCLTCTAKNDNMPHDVLLCGMRSHLF